jgi:hypothetical protein
MLVLVILGLGFGTVAQTYASTVVNESSHHAEGQAALGASPAFWVENLSISPAQCSLDTGVCTVAIANKGINSSYDLVLAPNGCQIDVISAKNSASSTGTTLNGTAGGQILSGIQAGSNVLASCAVPISALVYETNGSAASGGFLMKLTNNGAGWPAGSIVGIPFSGVWTNSTINETSKLYQLEFVQDSNCGYASYHLPWGVVLDNSTTVVQPSNASLPLAYDSQTSVSHSDSNYSTITFSVPNGTYSYTIIPKDPFNRIQSGNVTVDGSDAQVEVWEFVTAMGCTTSTATITTINGAISTSSTTATTTIISTYVSTSIPTTSNSTALYGVAAVAVVFIIATGYLFMRGRKSTA